jgi:hypothetical protein
MCGSGLMGWMGMRKGMKGWELMFGGDVGANFFCISRWIYPGIGVWEELFLGSGFGMEVDEV